MAEEPQHPIGRSPRHRLTVALGATGAGVVAVGLAAASLAMAGATPRVPGAGRHGAAAGPHNSRAACTVVHRGRPRRAPGPSRVHLPADQADHPGYGTDWWYVIGTLHAGRRTFGYITDLGRVALNSDAAQLAESITMVSDVRENRHYERVRLFPLLSLSASSQTLDVRLPGTSLDGPMSAMRARATVPGAALDLRLRSIGSPMFVGGTGYLHLGGGFSYYYSLPRLATTGTITIGAHRYHVTGRSWLDHQYGDFAITKINWRWQAEQLSNGVAMNLSVVDPSPRRAIWHGAANVLLPGGRLYLAPITMQPAASVFHSRQTGNSYFTRWIVKIPSFGACLTVVSRPSDQELVLPGSPPEGFYEGVSVLSGTFRGRPVSGQAWDEQFLPSSRRLGEPPGHGPL